MARFQAAAADPSGLARVSGPGRAALASRCVWNEGRAAPTRTKVCRTPCAQHAVAGAVPRLRAGAFPRLCSPDDEMLGEAATPDRAACAVLSIDRERGSRRP